MKNLNIAFDYRIDKGPSWDVFVFDETHQYKISIEKKPITNGGSFKIEPTLNIPKHDMADVANALLNGLSESGFCHKDGATTAELNATKKHLDNMVRLVFDQNNQLLNCLGSVYVTKN